MNPPPDVPYSAMLLLLRFSRLQQTIMDWQTFLLMRQEVVDALVHAEV